MRGFVGRERVTGTRFFGAGFKGFRVEGFWEGKGLRFEVL